MKPAIFNDTERSTEIAFDERGAAHLTVWPTISMYKDLDGYLPSDMPEKTRVSANHSHIYIDGAMKAGTKITVRQGVVSASSLGDAAQVIGGVLLIISDEQLSQMSKNFQRPSNDNPTILVVPEAERARAFDILTQKVRHYPGCPAEQLKEFLTENPKLPVTILPGNAEDAGLLREAGVPMAGRGRS
jgi:hypothetical protein